MNTLINFFRRLFGGGAGPQDKREHIVSNLMKALEMTQDQELGCEEVFELLDQYAELIIEDKDAREYMPLVAHHLEMCGHCREEFEVLIDIMRVEIA